MEENEIFIASKYGVADIVDRDMPLFRAAIGSGRGFTIHIDSIKDFNSATVDIYREGVDVDVTDVIDELIYVVGDGMEDSGIKYYINDPAYDRFLAAACDACADLYQETYSETAHLASGADADAVLDTIRTLQDAAGKAAETGYLLVKNTAAAWMTAHRKEYGI